VEVDLFKIKFDNKKIDECHNVLVILRKSNLRNNSNNILFSEGKA
jgi:hypothetical protein